MSANSIDGDDIYGGYGHGHHDESDNSALVNHTGGERDGIVSGDGAIGSSQLNPLMNLILNGDVLNDGVLSGGVLSDGVLSDRVQNCGPLGAQKQFRYERTEMSPLMCDDHVVLFH